MCSHKSSTCVLLYENAYLRIHIAHPLNAAECVLVFQLMEKGTAAAEKESRIFLVGNASYYSNKCYC